MDLNHLHLHVRDVDRARKFYETWFGMKERVRQGRIVFLGNADGFDLALAPETEPERFPEWFHFGFRQPSASAVLALHDRMKEAGVRIPLPCAEAPDYVSYRCADPDGYGIEIYWGR